MCVYMTRICYIFYICIYFMCVYMHIFYFYVYIYDVNVYICTFIYIMNVSKSIYESA